MLRIRIGVYEAFATASEHLLLPWSYKLCFGAVRSTSVSATVKATSQCIIKMAAFINIEHRRRH